MLLIFCVEIICNYNIKIVQAKVLFELMAAICSNNGGTLIIVMLFPQWYKAARVIAEIIYRELNNKWNYFQ